MHNLKVVTWNVNSLRVRLDQLFELVKSLQPNLISLQETKISDEEFPFATLKELGYTVVASGQRSYNGVAILSHEKVDDIILDLPGLYDPQRRVLGVMVQGVRVLNVYVPNGEHIFSKKYEYKLDWLKNFDNFLQKELTKHSKIIIMGDFNIAPENIDVFNPKRWENKVLFSEKERKAFKEILQIGFKDCYRLMDTSDKNYTWWDYRFNSYQKNSGLRIDHILASDDLAQFCVECFIDKNPRGWDRPSDHAPVVAEFRFG